MLRPNGTILQIHPGYRICGKMYFPFVGDAPILLFDEVYDGYETKLVVHVGGGRDRDDRCVGPGDADDAASNGWCGDGDDNGERGCDLQQC